MFGSYSATDVFVHQINTTKSKLLVFKLILKPSVIFTNNHGCECLSALYESLLAALSCSTLKVNLLMVLGNTHLYRQALVKLEGPAQLDLHRSLFLILET